MARRHVLQARRLCVTLRVRFGAEELRVIDAERARLIAASGRPCDRSQALRAVVRRFGATYAEPPAHPSRLTVRDAKRETDASVSDAAALNAALRARFTRAGLDAPRFCARYGVAQGVFEGWLKGRDARFLTLAKIARGLDEEGVP